jgi:hypothetical protein
MGYKHEKYSPRLLPEDENSAEIGANVVATMLGINIYTLSLWVKAGKVKPTKVVETTSGPIRKWSLADIAKLKQRLVYKPKGDERS